MPYKNQAKFISLIAFVAFLFLLEPALREKLTFALTYFDPAKVSSEQIDNNKYLTEPVSSPTTPQRSHAPEPSTLLLLLGGVGGIIVRFARKRFEEFKRATDLGLSILGLAITSPILIFAAILIKLNSKGPVVYKQNRVGRNGSIFQIYKLRTMHIDAEKQTGAIWAKANDTRVTSVGIVLRNRSYLMC
jgi:hypothetical protein